MRLGDDRCLGWLAPLMLGLMLGLAGSALAQQTAPAATPKAPPQAGWATAVAPPRAAATGVRLDGTAQRTRFRLEVTRQISANIFALASPYRVIVDVPDLEFRLPAGAGTSGHGVIGAYRFGQFEAGKSRIVVDVTAPVLIESARFVAASAGQPAALEFEIVAVSPEKFSALSKDAPTPQPDALRASRFDDAVEPADRQARTRPVIVIDPGHGGPDPGTVAGPNLYEKAIVLAIARQLKAALLAGRRYDVFMTREEDVFVSLDQRVRLSRLHAADLFVSLHIDAFGEADIAQSLRGASIYTLSDQASNEAARRLAEKENASDILAGLETVPTSAEDQVRSILIDLVRRETANFSAELRHRLAESFKGKVPLAKDPLRSAAFKVLKQADTPSVLIELGYLSNPEDQARLTKPDSQRMIAATIAAAIDSYFAPRTARVRREAAPR